MLKSVEKHGLDLADTTLLSSLTIMEIILTCFQTTRIDVDDVKTMCMVCALCLCVRVWFCAIFDDLSFD